MNHTVPAFYLRFAYPRIATMPGQLSVISYQLRATP